mgnify:CR=1 FL=1
MLVIGTNTQRFKDWYATQGAGKNNGAYWYAKEIEELILPTFNALPICVVTAGAKLYTSRDIPAGSVIICHDNRSTFKSYWKLYGRGNLWVCSKHSSVDTLKAKGENAVYVPLSIDTGYIKQFKLKKRTKDTAFVGNAWGFKKSYLKSLPPDSTQLSDMPREALIKEMAKYKHVIAEGRCLMEAQTLGAKCEVPQYNDIEAVYIKPLDSKQSIQYWEAPLQAHATANASKCIIKVMKSYKDITTGTERKVGEVYSVSKSRAEELLANKLNLVEIIE